MGKNTSAGTVVVTTKPTQTVQTIQVKPNGNTVIIEKDKNVVKTDTTKTTVIYDATGKPLGESVTTKTIRDVTTPITRSVINKDGDIIKEKVKIHRNRHVTKTTTFEPYTSPDYGTDTPTPIVYQPVAGQGDQIRCYPTIDGNGQIAPPVTPAGSVTSVGSVAVTTVGSVIGQTFLSPKNGIITKINLRVLDLGNAGDMTVNLCYAKQSGEPDFGRVIASKTIAFADLAKGWLSFALTPAYVQKGVRYAVGVVSTGAHTLQTAVGGKYSQGTFFLCEDGAWIAGYPDEDLGMQVVYAEFAQTQMTISMNPLDLAGGIGGVMFKNYEIVPEGCSITRQLQINGVWETVDGASDAYPLTNLPALALMRYVISGTKDVMPLMNLDISKSISFRPRTDFVGVTKLISTGVNVTSAIVTMRMIRFVEADHDCTIALLKSDNTVITASAVVDTATEDPLIIERKATFTFTALNSFRIRVTGATNSALNLYGAEEILYSAA
jgi:hypothetical protein